jgi:hypothetical protein
MPIVRVEHLGRSKALPGSSVVGARAHEVHEFDKTADGDFGKMRDKKVEPRWTGSNCLEAAAGLGMGKPVVAAAAAAAAVEVVVVMGSSSSRWQVTTVGVE